MTPSALRPVLGNRTSWSQSRRSRMKALGSLNRLPACMESSAMQWGEQGAQAVLCFVVLPCAVLLRCNQKQMLTAPACEFLGGWKQSCFCASPSRLRPCALLHAGQICSAG